MRKIAILMINFYQRFLSPVKGFRCAYGALHGKGTCSQIVKDIVRHEGVFKGWPKIKQQFNNCKSAYLQLQDNPDLDKGKKKKKRKCDNCDCPSPCDLPISCGGKGGGGGLDCDSPCDFDLPCDCSP